MILRGEPEGGAPPSRLIPRSDPRRRGPRPPRGRAPCRSRESRRASTSSQEPRRHGRDGARSRRHRAGVETQYLSACGVTPAISFARPKAGRNRSGNLTGFYRNLAHTSGRGGAQGAVTPRRAIFCCAFAVDCEPHRRGGGKRRRQKQFSGRSWSHSRIASGLGAHVSLRFTAMA